MRTREVLLRILNNIPFPLFLFIMGLVAYLLHSEHINRIIVCILLTVIALLASASAVISQKLRGKKLWSKRNKKK